MVVASTLTNRSFSVNCPIPVDGNHISRLVRRFFRPFDTHNSSTWSTIQIKRSLDIYNETAIGKTRLDSKDVILIGGQHFGPDKLFFQRENLDSFERKTGMRQWNAIHHYSLRQAIRAQPYSTPMSNYSALHLRSGDSFMMYGNNKKIWRWQREIRTNVTIYSVIRCFESMNMSNTYLATDNPKIKQELKRLNYHVKMSSGNPILTGLYQDYADIDINSLFKDWYAIAYADVFAVYKRSTFSETARLWAKSVYTPLLCE